MHKPIMTLQKTPNEAQERVAVSSTRLLGFGDALRIARGCHDYSGGHHSDGHYDAYRRGQPQPPERDVNMQTANQITSGAANAEGGGCWSAPIC